MVKMMKITNLIPQAAQAHYVWVRASEVIWSEYTRIISVLSECQINAKISKMWSLLVCLSVIVPFKITKVDISCIITSDSGPYCSNFITCIRIHDAKEKKIVIKRNIASKSSLTFSSRSLCVLRPVSTPFSRLSFHRVLNTIKEGKVGDLPTDPRSAKANKFQTKRPISLKLPPASTRWKESRLNAFKPAVGHRVAMN